MAIDELDDLISESYNLEEHIVDRLEFYYLTKIGDNGNNNSVVLDGDRRYDSYMIRGAIYKPLIRKHVHKPVNFVHCNTFHMLNI